MNSATLCLKKRGARKLNSPVSTGTLQIRSVLIVDDHPLYSEALAASLQEFTDVKRIEIASSLAEAQQFLAKRFTPSLVFFDLNLPDATGVTGFINFIQKLNDVPMMVISATDSPEIIKIIHDQGAAGFISKNLSREEMQSAIEKVIAGERVFPEISEPNTPSAQIENGKDLQDISQKLAALTPRQSRILEMICEGKLNKQIAYELDLAEATVKTHITALMRRLGVQNRTQAALLVRDANAVANLK